MHACERPVQGRYPGNAAAGNRTRELADDKLRSGPTSALASHATLRRVLRLCDLKRLQIRFDGVRLLVKGH